MLAWLDIEALFHRSGRGGTAGIGLMTESELVGASERIHGQGCCGPVAVHLPQNSADLEPAAVAEQDG